MVGRGASWFKYKLDCLVHCYIVSNIFEVMPDLKKYKPLTKFHLFYAGIIFKTRFFPLSLYIILNKYIYNYIYTLLVCHGFVGPRVTQGEVCGWSNFLKFWKSMEFFDNFREIICFLLVLQCTQREHVHNCNRRWEWSTLKG